ncbi:peptidase domain-containing ABC transporter [Hazenella sp. IB182357]|uniref:Peptidase domain-containing ABC transporter n=1 Tax=Polycladospora coralii TaxID=2771432 RepID=A0A926RSY1_9BACL|nr:peptidase domain-containing ABC transporter [Polycladospora coralii]MBD1372090.1 peptidase domain-containing ABC transporter [Polycladospora coralii]MBS7530596.1 peptidase domain-containing ABC transporter [Polycladospora coralii]
MKEKKLRHRRRVPVIEQLQQTECGICCLAMIAGYYKKSVSFNDMHEFVSAGRDGVSLLNLRMLAEHLDFTAKVYKVNIGDLGQIRLPAVLYWENKHYVVLEKITKNAFVIIDPAFGRRKITPQQFEVAFSSYVLTCVPTEKFTQQKETNIWIPFFKILWEKPSLFLSILFITLFLQLITLGIPTLIQFVIDKVIQAQRMELLNTFLLGLALSLMFHTAFTYLRGKSLITLNNRLDEQMMKRFFRHLLQLPYQFFQLRSFGDLIFRANSLRVIRDILSNQLIKGVLDFSLLFVVLAYMFSQSMILTGFVVCLASLNIILMIWSRPRITEANQEEIVKSTAVQGLQVEVLYGIFGVKSAGVEKNLYGRWDDKFNDLLKAYRRKETVMNRLNTVTSALGLMSPMLVLWVGAQLVFEGAISLGALIALHTLANQLFSLSSSIVHTGNSFFLASSYLRRVQDVLDAPIEYQPENPVKLEKLKGEIELQRVDFSYTKYTTPSVRNISMRVKPGKKVAIIGKSGSGKSTLARLILGLYQPTQGRILYDGFDLNQLEKSSLRRQIGVVPQDVTLFNRSILENIKIHNPEASLEQVIEAAQIAQIHDEIMKMPMKYNTIISEMGMNISGGQRQRIAVARALVHKPSILVLDEATSSLDYQNEEKMDRYLTNMNCTRVVIAHRLSTVMNADLIIVMDEGRIVEKGTHESLLQKEGFYEKFFSKQMLEKQKIQHVI